MRTIRFIYFIMERKSESNKLISKNLNKHRGVLFGEGFNRVKERRIFSFTNDSSPWKYVYFEDNLFYEF